MHTTTLFEHGFSTGFHWDDRDLELIEQLNREYGDEILHATTRNGAHEVQARQYVGVLQIGDRVIQVLPKIHRAGLNDAAATAEAGHNLLHSLNYSNGLTIREMQVAPLQPLTYRVTAAGGGGSVFGVNPLFRTA